MTPHEIEALAMTGAATIVAAMATDAWSTARTQAVELFRRHSPARHAELEALLDANAALVGRAQDADRARLALIGLWQLELEGFLTRHPELAEELKALTVKIKAALPDQGRQFAQTNTARDHGIVNAVQHGTQHNHYMDSNPRPPARLAPAPDEGDD